MLDELERKLLTKFWELDDLLEACRRREWGNPYDKLRDSLLSAKAEVRSAVVEVRVIRAREIEKRSWDRP